MRYTHPRSSWVDPSEPVDGPAFDWRYIDYFVPHWPGHDNVPDGDIGDSTDLPAFLRQMHHRYLNKRRPYSLGYGSGGDYLGGTWEIRGTTYRNAANAPADFNLRSYSHQIWTDLDGIVTDLAIDACNDLIAQAQAIRPSIIVVGHGQGDLYYPSVATECPGPIADLIANGTIGRRAQPPPTTDMEVQLMASTGGYLVAKLRNGSYWIGTPVWHKWCSTAEMAERYIDSLDCRDLATGRALTYRGDVTAVAAGDLTKYMGQRVS